jgi:hypothetical protein
MKTTFILASLFTVLTAQASEFFGSLTFNNITLDITLNDVTNKVTFDVAGPKSGYISMGFGAQQMDGAYCIIANEGGVNNSQERILGFHSYGTKLATDLITVDSYSATNTIASYTITRDLTVSSTEAQAYDFVAQEGTIEIMLAYGNTTGQYHTDRFAGTINFQKISNTSTKENIVAQQLKIYPNPTSQALNIQITKASTTTNVSIYSLEGTLIKVANFVNKEVLTVDVNNLSAGSYLVKVKGSKFLSSSVFIKK